MGDGQYENAAGGKGYQMADFIYVWPKDNGYEEGVLNADEIKFMKVIPDKLDMGDGTEAFVYGILIVDKSDEEYEYCDNYGDIYIVKDRNDAVRTLQNIISSFKGSTQ